MRKNQVHRWHLVTRVFVHDHREQARSYSVSDRFSLPVLLKEPNDVSCRRGNRAEPMSRCIVTDRLLTFGLDNAPTGERNELVRQTIRRF